MSVKLEYRLTIGEKLFVYDSLCGVRCKINSTHFYGRITWYTVGKALREIVNHMPNDCSSERRDADFRNIRYLLDMVEERSGGMNGRVIWSQKAFGEPKLWHESEDNAELLACRHALNEGDKLEVVTVRNTKPLNVAVPVETIDHLYSTAHVLGVDPAIIVECALDDYFHRGEVDHG